MTSICSITGVLPSGGGQRRHYVPRGSRPHLAWVAEGTEPELGTRRAVTPSSPAVHLGLKQLVTVDSASATCLEVHRPGGTQQSPAIPSLAPISTLLLEGDGHLYASDVRGNVFEMAMTELLGGDKEERPAQRRRTEEGEAGELWRPLTPSRRPQTSEPLTGASWWSAACGLPGWAGLATLSGTQQLLSLREFYQDARVLDRETGAVLRAYTTTHPPTGLHTPPALPHCFLVAEGPLCTLLDTRCKSAALSWSEATRPAAWQALATEKHSLVVNRLTSVSGEVRDVCGTANPNEVAACVDRALCVYDLRKFTRLATSTNILKYDIASITPLCSGTSVACIGIDAEVRLVALNEMNSASHSKKVNGQEESSESLAGTFRTRLNQTVCCEQFWQGGWVTSLGSPQGAAAVGISITGEVFLAQ